MNRSSLKGGRERNDTIQSENDGDAARGSYTRSWDQLFLIAVLPFSFGEIRSAVEVVSEQQAIGVCAFLAAEAAEQFTSSSDDEHIFIFPTSSSSSGTNATVEGRQLAINAFEQLIKQYPASRYIKGVKLKLGKLYLWSKEWDKADKLFAELAASGNEDSEVLAYQAMLNTRKEIPDKEAALTGKVMIGEKPASGVFVVLHRSDDNGWSSPPYLHYPIAITDEQGEYRFYDVTANEYEIGVGVTPAEVSGYYLTQAARERVSIAAGKTETYNIQFVPKVSVVSPVNKEQITGDRLRFVWNAYPGTDYYLLSITSFYRDEKGKSVGTSTVQLSDEKLKDTTAEYSLEELRGSSRGFGKSYNADGRVALSNTGVLGAIFPGEILFGLLMLIMLMGAKYRALAAIIQA